MWKLWNKLFGYDYIHWENSVTYGIARVHISPDGTVYFWRYKSTKCCDIVSTKKGGVGFKIIWLTCKPSKYGLADEA